MNQFQREQLSRPNESFIIRIEESKRKEGEEIGEEDMKEEIRIGVRDEVEPIRWFRRTGRGRFGEE